MIYERYPCPVFLIFSHHTGSNGPADAYRIDRFASGFAVSIFQVVPPPLSLFFSLYPPPLSLATRLALAGDTMCYRLGILWFVFPSTLRPTRLSPRITLQDRWSNGREDQGYNPSRVCQGEECGSDWD